MHLSIETPVDDDISSILLFDRRGAGQKDGSVPGKEGIKSYCFPNKTGKYWTGQLVEIKLKNYNRGTMNQKESFSPDNPVLLVPGYRDDASVFARFVDYLAGQRFRVFPITLTPSDGRVPLEALAGQVARFAESAFATGEALDFVGFSMGGCVLRYYLQRMNGLARTQRFVTLGTPHRGTWTAYASNRPGVRQMRPGSPFLDDLATDAHRLASINFTSIWTPLDLTIVPARSSALPVGRQERVRIAHHRALVTSRRSLERVAAALRSPLEVTVQSPHPTPPRSREETGSTPPPQ